MEHPFLDFLCASLIPVLCTDVTAGTACNIHLILVSVAAVGAFPDELAVFFADFDFTVVAALLAVVGLCIELSVNDVIVDELHKLKNSLGIVLHIGYLNIADSTAG